MAKAATGRFDNAIALARNVWTQFINTTATVKEIAADVGVSAPTVNRILREDPKALRTGDRKAIVVRERQAKCAPTAKGTGNAVGSNARKTPPAKPQGKSNMIGKGASTGGKTRTHKSDE